MSFFFMIINALFHFFELIGAFIRRIPSICYRSFKRVTKKGSHMLRLPKSHEVKNYTPIQKRAHTRHEKPLQFMSSRYVRRRARLRVVRWSLLSIFVLVVSGALGYGIYQGYAFFTTLPSPANIGKVNYSLTSHIYDRNGKLLYVFYHDQNRTPIKLDGV
jgi:hypothetical protein